jgi:ParB-like chromosome segregation protein Spo0J
MDAKISEALKPLAVSINSIHPMEGNARKGDVSAVKRSLMRFGQRKPVVAMADGTISAGHHLHAAAVDLGWQEIAVVFEDDDPIEARAWALADNRTGDLGRYDNELLAASLIEVRAADSDLLEAASYTSDDVDDLLRFLEGPTKVPDEISGDGGVDEGGDDGDACPNCGFPLD